MIDQDPSEPANEITDYSHSELPTNMKLKKIYSSYCKTRTYDSIEFGYVTSYCRFAPPPRMKIKPPCGSRTVSLKVSGSLSGPYPGDGAGGCVSFPIYSSSDEMSSPENNKLIWVR